MNIYFKKYEKVNITIDFFFHELQFGVVAVLHVLLMYRQAFFFKAFVIKIALV